MVYYPKASSTTGQVEPGVEITSNAPTLMESNVTNPSIIALTSTETMTTTTPKAPKFYFTIDEPKSNPYFLVGTGIDRIFDILNFWRRK